MAEKFFWKRGDDSAKTVSVERIEEIKRGAAHDEERDGAEAERLTRPVPRYRPPGRVNAIGPGVWRHCGAGLDPAIVRARLEERRAEDRPNPEYYARRTLESAAASLRQEIPGHGA